MKKKRVNFLLNICICILCLLLIRTTWDQFKIYQDGKKEAKRKEVYQELSLHEEAEDKKIKRLQEQFDNPQIIGILSIPNTSFQTVLVQGKDNSYYLSHALDKTSSIYGSTFLDYRTSLDKRKLMIYGHNAQNFETEFQFLLNYLDANFYQEHPIITLETENGTKEYEIFSVMIVPIGSEEHAQVEFTEASLKEQLIWAKEHSLYSTKQTEDVRQILVLQTCNFKPKNTYFVIYSKER